MEAKFGLGKAFRGDILLNLWELQIDWYISANHLSHFLVSQLADYCTYCTIWWIYYYTRVNSRIRYTVYIYYIFLQRTYFILVSQIFMIKFNICVLQKAKWGIHNSRVWNSLIGFSSDLLVFCKRKTKRAIRSWKRATRSRCSFVMSALTQELRSLFCHERQKRINHSRSWKEGRERITQVIL